MLSQLSYRPVNRSFNSRKSTTESSRACSPYDWWAQEESNFRPRPYQGRALPAELWAPFRQSAQIGRRPALSTSLIPVFVRSDAVKERAPKAGQPLKTE
jgi:hypothetical protein